MEALVSQDFEFNVLSRAYGEFLVECSNSYPEGRIERVPDGLYLNKDQSTIQVHFQSPESVAVFLKLKFGAYLRQRPFPKMDEELYQQIRKLSKMYNKNSYFDEKYKSYDYINIIKTRTQMADEYFLRDPDKEDYSE